MGRWIPIVGIVLLLAAPFVLRPGTPTEGTDGRRLVVVTPHNEQIRSEFARAFDEWHRRTFDEAIRVEWSTPGGTSEIRKLLLSEYTAALEDGLSPGGNADLVWGGGSYEFGVLARPIEVTVDGETRSTSVLAPLDFTDAELAAVYGDGEIAGEPLYDVKSPDGPRWFGTALSSFGVVFNRDALEMLDLPEPGTWQDLCAAGYQGWLTMVDPGMSGSVTTAFDAILQRRGWDDGWRILRRLAANAHSFAGSSTAGPLDAAAGETAAAVCIDFYGRYEAQRTRDAAIQAGLAERDAVGRIGYVDPPGETVIDPDPIAMLTGAPDRELARRFVEFVLSVDGQALWQFRAGPEGRGPRRFELRRMPIRRDLYRNDLDRFVDQVDPWAIATPVASPNFAMRAFIAPMFRGMALDQPALLREAWRAILAHPAYPHERGPLVTASMVDDPTLRAMLEAFDALPVVVGPAGVVYDLADPGLLAEVKAGWLRGGWEGEDLWPKESDPSEMFRRLVRIQSAERYREILRLAGGSA